jgi:hypothetical protein
VVAGVDDGGDVHACGGPRSSSCADGVIRSNEFYFFILKNIIVMSMLTSACLLLLSHNSDELGPAVATVEPQ